MKRFRLSSNASQAKAGSPTAQRKLDRKIYDAVKSADAAKVTDLLAAGANPNAPVGKKGMTAMHRVAAREPSNAATAELEELLVAGGGERIISPDPDRAPSELAPVDDDAANAVVVPTLSTKTAVFTVKITAEGTDVEFGAPAGLVVITAFTGPNATYAAVGDEVVAVNGTPTAGLGLADVTALKAGTGDGPLILKLEREFATDDAAAAAAGDVGVDAGDKDAVAADVPASEEVDEGVSGAAEGAVATATADQDLVADAVVVPTLSAKTAVFTVKITAEGADVEFGAPAGLVVITAFTGLPNATYAAVGDEVVAVNGTPTAGLGLTDVTALKAGTGDGPLTLKLEREFATSDAAAAAAGDVGAGAGDGDGAAAAVGEPSVGEVPNAVATLAPKAQKKQDRKLYDAVKANDMAKVTELLAAGANPNAPVGKKKMTAMHRVAASNSSELEDLLVAGGGERRLRALEDAGAEEQMMLERMMSENELGGNSNDINDSSLLAEGDDDDDAAAAAEAAAGPSADGSDDVDDSPRSKRVSSVDNVTVDDSEADGDASEYQAFVHSDGSAPTSPLTADNLAAVAAAHAAATAALIGELADGEDVFVERPGPVIRKMSTYSISLDQDNEVVLQDLKDNGRGAASNFTQKLVRDRRSTRIVKAGSKVTLPVKGDAPTDHYDVSKKLGNGAFGAVSLVVQKKTGGQFAMKHIDLNKLGGASINLYLSLREIELMKRLDHPNVIKLFEVFRDDDNIYMILELCMGGELEEVLGEMPELATQGGGLPPMVPRFPEARAKALVSDMLAALSYIHANGIVHRDIKLENYVFSGPGPGEGIIKMIDFGLSRAALDGDTMTQDVGSLVYKAPEIASGSYTELSDLWSFGMVAHMILTGIVPWEGSQRAEIQASITRELSDVPGFHSFLGWMSNSSCVSDDGASFICGLLTPEPSERLTCSTARQHPWLTGGPGALLRSPSMKKKAHASELQMVRRLKDFKNNDALKRTVLLAMSFGVASAEMVQLGEKFKAMDLDHDGLIGWEEFNDAMLSYGAEDEEENREIFDAINQDGTGKIKYSEFVASQLEKDIYDANEQLEAAFHRLDFNDDGKIGMEELLVLLQGPDSDEAEAKEEALATLTALGKGPEGQIDMEEFKTAMRGVFSPEEIEAGEGADGGDGGEGSTDKPASIGQFKLMQLRLASQLQFKPTTDESEAVPQSDKIGQFNLMRLMLASRLQFKDVPEGPTDKLHEAESTVGQFKLRRLMFVSQLQAFKPGGSAHGGLEPPLIKRGSTKTRLAPGSFRRRLTVAQKSAAPLDVLMSSIGDPTVEETPETEAGQNSLRKASTAW